MFFPHTSNNSFGTQGESTSGFGNAFIAGTENDKNKTTLSYIAGGDDQLHYGRHCHARLARKPLDP